jgi:hypothetical protein
LWLASDLDGWIVNASAKATSMTAPPVQKGVLPNCPVLFLASYSRSQPPATGPAIRARLATD